jgi:guanylate kinase
MLEASCFNDWWYGTALSSLDKNKINIGVFNVEGIRCLLDNELIEVYPIAITTKPKTRIIRQLTREENPDIKEIFRRYDADERDFSFVDFPYKVVHNENDEGLIELTEIINSL